MTDAQVQETSELKLALNYSLEFNAALGISYADLLERIQEKCGFEKFKLTKSTFKKIRMRRWQETATAEKISVTAEIYAAIERMTQEQDPCIEILSKTGKVQANVELRLIKLPLHLGTDSLKALSKAKLFELAEERGEANAKLHSEVLTLKKELKTLQEKVDTLKAKAAVNEDPLPEENYADFPPNFETRLFPDLIPAYVPGKKRRAYFRSKELWPFIMKHVSFIDTWQKQEDQRRRSKLSAQVMADEAAGLIQTKMSDRGAESRSAITHFFKFVKLTIGPDSKEFVPTQEHLLSPITLNAFLAFYRQRTNSPSTANNVAKMLVSLFKYMKCVERFDRFLSRIKCMIRHCRNFIQLMDQAYAEYRAKKLLDNYLLIRGEWLKAEELARLTAKICEEIVEYLDNTDTDKKRSMLSKDSVLEFQMLLILYSYLQLGGQRREVVAMFMVGNFAAVENKVIYFTIMEKVQKRNSDRLPLPTTLGQLIRIWVDKYRPLLLKKNSAVKSCWINKKGAPLPCHAITRGVIHKIASIFPHRTIGPQVLRRLFVSLMHKITLENPDEYNNWPALHAPLINTSVAMLGSHYNRANGHKQSEKANAMINNALELNPTQDAADAIAQHAQNTPSLDVVQDPILKIIEERILGPKTEFLCIYKSGKQAWVDDTQLDVFCDVVLAFYNSFGGEVQELDPVSDDEEDDNADTDDDAEEDVDVPALESASSVEDESETSVNETETCPATLPSSHVVVEVVQDATLLASSDYEAAPVSPCVTKKRKRVGSDKGPPRKVSKISYDGEEMLLNNRAIKPGDIVSVNPENSKDKFWLAEVVKVVNQSKVNIKWLEKTGKRFKYSYGARDTLDPLTLNGFAPGEWLDNGCYTCK